MIKELVYYGLCDVYFKNPSTAFVVRTLNDLKRLVMLDRLFYEDGDI